MKWSTQRCVYEPESRKFLQVANILLDTSVVQRLSGVAVVHCIFTV